uniref:Uncharacterized protein n=1 Tax=Arundo donax TaxID=35708 RepID=A0A0A9FKU6_ARUDO
MQIQEPSMSAMFTLLPPRTRYLAISTSSVQY